MDTTKLVIYIIFLLTESFFISFVMESYKNVWRKNKAKQWECRLLAILLAVGCEALLIYSGLIFPVFHNLYNAKLWLDHLMYFGLFYFFQMKSSMIIIKKLIRSFVGQWLESNLNINLEDIQILAEKRNREAYNNLITEVKNNEST